MMTSTSQTRHNSIANRIDDIIYSGVAELTSKEHMEVNSERYKSSSAQELVIDRIRALIFENSSSEFVQLFNSDAGALEMCQKNFLAGDFIFSCSQCSSDSVSAMCEDCFINSQHINHAYILAECSSPYGHCNCGFKDAWTSRAICTIHESSARGKICSEEFELHVTAILKRLLEYLKKIGTPLIYWNSSPTLLSKNANEINGSEGYFIVLLDDDCLNYEDVINMLTRSLGITQLEARKYVELVDEHEFTRAFPELTVEEDHIMESDDEYTWASREFPPNSIVTIAEFMVHMRLSLDIMCFINDFVCKKAELCDLLTHALFNETALFVHFIHNETRLWNVYRQCMIYKVISCILYSEPGKIHIANAYLDNLEKIYLNYVDGDNSVKYFIFDLTIQFISCPSVTTILIKKNFLFRLIECFSIEIKKIGIMERTILTDIFSDDVPLSKKISKICYLDFVFGECLSNESNHDYWLEVLGKERIVEGVIRFIKFLGSIGEIEPLQKNTPGKGSYTPHFLLAFVSHIHCIMDNVKKFALLDDVTTNCIVRHIWNIFVDEYSSKSGTDDKTLNDVLNDVIKYHNVETQPFSIFNFHVRFFVDILMRIYSTQTLEESLEKIFTNHKILLWMGIPAITSLSFLINYQISPWQIDHGDITDIIKYYHSWPTSHYLFEQDFYFIQILISHIDPEIFIRYLALNVYPLQRTENNLTIPLSHLGRIISVPQTTMYAHMLRFIYAALTERHIIGQVDSVRYEYMKREVIHRLLPSGISRKRLRKQIFCYNQYFNVEESDSLKCFDQILEEVADIKKTYHNRECTLKDEYFREINRFYYHYSMGTVSQVYNFLTRCQRKYPVTFKPRELPNLKPQFHGISNFILSEPFKDFLLNIMNCIWVNSDKEYFNSDLLELVLLCMSLIIGTLTYPFDSTNNKSNLNSLMLPQSIFDGKTIIDFLLDTQENTTDRNILAIVNYAILQLDLIQPTSSQSQSKQEEDKKCSEISKNILIGQLNDEHERFIVDANNPDAPFYKKFILNISTLSDSVLNDSENNNYCTICQSSSDQLRSDICDIFSFPTELLCLGHLKWTKALGRRFPIIDESYYSDECKISLEDIQSNNPHAPTLNLSGCGHLFHLHCVQENSIDLEVFLTEKLLKETFKCCYCTSKGNILLPYIPPFPHSKQLMADIISFTSIIDDLMISCNFSPHTLSYKILTSLNDLRSTYCSTNQVESDFQPFSINYVRFYYPIISCVKHLSSDYTGEYFDSIIAITQHCLSSTVSYLEIINRNHSDNTSLFHRSVIESTNFRICSQLARFCYYTSGIAPIIKHSSTRIVDVQILVHSYLRSCHKMFKILLTIQNVENGPDEFAFVRHIHPLSLLISTLIGLFCINKLKSPCLINDSFSIASTSFKFVFLILTLNIFTTFELERGFSNYQGDASDEEIQSIFNLYALLCSEPNHSNFDFRKTLYYTWLYRVLPFCRQAAMLFYQLFERKPHHSLTSTKCLSPSRLIKELLNYLEIPDLHSILFSTEITIFKNYATNAKLFYILENCNTIRPYLEDYFSEKISLVELPSSYIELIIQMKKILCSKCKASCKSAYKCLICGKFIIKKFGCTCFPNETHRNLINKHMCKCDISQCIFLLLKQPVIFYSSGSEVNQLEYPIYEDIYGEASLKFKTSLKLCKENYQRLSYCYQRDIINSLGFFPIPALKFYL